LADLRKCGATVETELAIRWWVNGQTIGPDSVGSIAAVGQLSGVAAIEHNVRDFDRAFRKIRAVHQGIGRRLAYAIRRSFRHAADPNSEHRADQLDEHLSLPISELLESIDFAEVATVSKDRVLVAPSRVGRLVTL
jgi:hypothetical protein